MMKLEAVALDVVDDIPVTGVRYKGNDYYEEIIGESRNGMDLVLGPAFYLVRWTTKLDAEAARKQLQALDRGVNQSIEVVYATTPHVDTPIEAPTFAAADLTAVLQMSIMGTNADDPNLLWRLPLPDQPSEKHEQCAVYVSNETPPLPDPVSDLIRNTSRPENSVSDIDRTIASFHTIYTKYVTIVAT